MRQLPVLLGRGLAPIAQPALEPLSGDESFLEVLIGSLREA